MELGADNSSHFRAFEDEIGRVLIPDSAVSDGVGGSQFVITNALTTAERWPDLAGGRRCVVWFEDNGQPDTATPDAIYEGMVVQVSAGVYRVDVPHLFGRGGVASAPFYRVLVLGPSMSDSTPELGWTNYTHLGNLTGAIGVVKTITPSPTLFSSFGAAVLALNAHINDSVNPHGSTLTQTTLQVNGTLEVHSDPGTPDPVVKITEEDGVIAPANLDASVFYFSWLGGLEIDASAHDWCFNAGDFVFKTGTTLQLDSGADLDASGGASIDFDGSAVALSANATTINLSGFGVVPDSPVTERKLIGPADIKAGLNRLFSGGEIEVDVGPNYGLRFLGSNPGDSAEMFIDLTDYLPNGVVISLVRVQGDLSTDGTFTFELFRSARTSGARSSIYNNSRNVAGNIAFVNAPLETVNTDLNLYGMALTFASAGDGGPFGEEGRIRYIEIVWERPVLFAGA